MKEPAPLPFLARPGYRRRRLIEAIKLMPFVGVLFILLPLLWATSETDDPARTSNGWIYIFTIWIFLIAMAAVAAWTQKDSSAQQDPETEDDSL